ncbi:unnamed protein product [Orchesella dallaii]|uniref:AB hydrolase-1 domain-containing protein n=1 Tax=Orchesella dallaii TaxID=48710 RepID=A0ABP1S088_9HEXA
MANNLSLVLSLCGAGVLYRYRKLHMKRRSRRQLHFGFKIAVGATLLLYLLIPILYHFNSSVQRHLVFLPFVRWPAGINFSDPDSQGLQGCRNFYLLTQEDVSVGVWHILPRSLIQESKGKESKFWEDSMRSSGKNVVIYFHGNTGSRAVAHRMELYLILQQLDYHVISFDYRGYADSTQIPPSETGVVTDGYAVYKYVRSILGASSDVNVFIWGHSLGTGKASYLSYQF